LREKVMPVIADCRDLTDFLMLSLNSSSQKRKFLALECFYDLIVRYNIEYPGLYGQLLDMCSDRSFRLSTYSLSFLTILRKFVMSTKLSLELIKSFIIRLGNVSLKCESSVLLSILGLLRDMVHQHKLLCGPQGESTREEFLDVLLAVQDTMKSHFNPAVRKAATNLLKEVDEKSHDNEPGSFSDIDEIMQNL